MDRVDYHIAEAEDRLEAAQLLLQNQKYRDAVSRAYYKGNFSKDSQGADSEIRRRICKD